MTYNFTLNWAILTLSLFNTILLLWLGSTVLLNAERRTWGMWLAGGGLLLGGAFFVSHTAILGRNWHPANQEDLRFWLYVGMVPAVISPLGWYLVMLWYTGFWDNPGTALRRRQWPGLVFIAVVAISGMAAVIIYANPLPDLFNLLTLRYLIKQVGGTWLLVGGYGLYLIACSALTLDALLRPGPSNRIMGELARQRARQWLIVASFLLLLVSLAVIAVLIWSLLTTRQGNYLVVSEYTLFVVAEFDLIISLLIAVAVLVIGQAIVAYEIFTGKSLPRGGLRRQWQQAVLLAAGFSSLVAATLLTSLQPMYSVLLATILMTAFMALLSWRSYTERDRYIEHLRPFVASQHLYDHLLTAALVPPEMDIAAPFYALCHDVLGAARAYLVPLGPLAPLAGAPLAYPPEITTAPGPLNAITEQLTSPQTVSLPLDPDTWAGAAWAIPLWSTRGLIGALLLGEKKDGSLYTQEEMEIARASGERLIDTQASVEMARRLVRLQRRQLAASQVADRRTRRVLHDEVLPQVHATLLALTGNDHGTEQAIDLLTDAHRQISNLLRDVPAAVTPAVDRLGILGALERAIAEEMDQAFDEVTWNIDEAERRRLRTLPSLTAEVLYYAAREAMRNAARHARRTNDQPLHLNISAQRTATGLHLVIEDNGSGLPVTTNNNDGGHGLALHSTMMAVVGGTLAVDSAPDSYTRVALTLPEQALLE